MMTTSARHSFFIVILTTCICLSTCGSSDSGRGYVRSVNDGDTITLENDVRVRYLGINAPEIAHEGRSAEPFGAEASEFNRKLADNQEVRLEFDKEIRDQYGRVLAYVFLKDGTFVNAALIAEGLAFCLPCYPECRYDASFLQLQKKAMTSGKGMWRNFRDQPGTYIGNIRSKRFHIIECSYGRQIGKRNRQYFKTKRDAFHAGFAPCAGCIGGKK